MAEASKTSGPERRVFSSDGKASGLVTSGGYRCSMEGCTGLRLPVTWSDGKHSRPCTKGMTTRPDGHLQIG